VIGVFGGSGFYDFLSDVTEVPVHTPYGPPSAPVMVGSLDGREVAFLPRHGRNHEVPPHRVNYRANVWAMHSLGVTRIIGPCAAGSLQPAVVPGSFVVLDQLVDRTWGRADTFFDGGVVGHVSFADPYCPTLRSVLVAACSSAGVAVHEQGTVVVVQGPRFSTRAESNWYRSAGWEVVNMTQYPEAFLARELGVCYGGLALITDYDTGLEGVDGIEPVTMDAVFKMLRRNVARTREVLFSAIPAVPVERAGCSCADALASGPLGS
ncbi:MAG TPA: S-methyl-5'-thioadenosine phosphorylase, partial [Acidimicrobiales bacterium]|nr:S-methyl-5'-thioadenosine phosphorylase [Acidimicrobiales bacterium]